MKLMLRPLTRSLLLVLIATGCSSASTPMAVPTLVLGSGSGPAASGGIAASGVVVPARHADLSFPLTGVVGTLFVQIGEQVKAGQPVIQLDTTLLEAEARVADADLQAEQIAYTYLARTGTDQEHLDSALADIARAQALLDVKKATVTQGTLLAPFDGTVAALEISPAETVVPGQVVLTLGDLTNFRVETTDLSERDAPLVQVGQTAEVEIIALDERIDGTVVDISRLSSTVGGDVVYKVTISLNVQHPGLLWGMSATVRVHAGE